MNNINYLRKQAGLPPLPEVTSADITRALDEVQRLAEADQLDESVYSTLKAILATVGQTGSKANKVAAERAKKLPDTIRALYKETEAKEQLRLMYKRFTQIITELDTIDSGTKNIQDRDIDIRRWVDLFQRLISRVTVDLQARAVAVKEAFSEAELEALLEVFLDDGFDYSDEFDLLPPAEELAEAKYVSAAEFSDDFYSLLDSLKNAARAVGSKRGKLRNWLRNADFVNKTQADELFDVFLDKFHLAMVALRSCDKELQKKL